MPTYPSIIYTIIFIISFCCWLIFEVWVFSRDHRTRKSNLQGLNIRFFALIAIIIGIVIAFNMPVIVPVSSIRNHFTVFFTLGITFIWIGIFFRYWAIRTLGKFFRTRLVIQNDHELITKGPYKYLRNPSYTGVLITFIGFGFGVANWLSIVVFIAVGLFTYIWRIRVEEQMLSKQFGKAYEDYKKRTWALIPFVW